jgi:hypothetical protein
MWDAPEWLKNMTFVTEFSANCNRQWMVRLVGYRRGMIDKLAPSLSQDAIGYGDTLREAAENAASVNKHRREEFRV